MKVKKNKKIDIVVGIPTLNSANTIEHVLKAVNLGLIKYFPKFSSLIVNADSNSKDKTPGIFRNYCPETGDLNSIILHKFHPASKRNFLPERALIKSKFGKGNALKNIFKMASEREAQACVVVDSDLRSITPEWIQFLAAPIIFQNYDYVTPLYFRHKYDGTITNSIIYPLTRALYDQNIRQPIGGEFGISKNLYENFLQKNIRGRDVEKFGIDIWMTTIALAEKYKIAQVFLGAKIHNEKDPSDSLAPMFSQVLKTLFELMEEYQHVWKKLKKERTTTLFGFETEVEPAPVKVDIVQLSKRSKSGIKKFKEFYKKIFTPHVLKRTLKNELLSFNPGLWADLVYQIAIFFHKNKGNENLKTKLIEAMIPLYFGHVAGFSKATENISSHESEIFIEKIYEEFEKKKPYLVKNWK